MAFVCTIPQGGFRVQGFAANTPHIAIIDIGYDDAEPLNYKVAVGLDALPGGGLELYFHVIGAEGETGGEHTFWSGRNTRFIKATEDRAAVLGAVLFGLHDLLKMSTPEGFVWFTYDEAMPRKALLKFEIVRRVIEECGYTVTASRLARGRRAWETIRILDDAVDSSGADPDPNSERR